MTVLISTLWAVRVWACPQARVCAHECEVVRARMCIMCASSTHGRRSECVDDVVKEVVDVSAPSRLCAVSLSAILPCSRGGGQGGGSHALLRSLVLLLVPFCLLHFRRHLCWNPSMLEPFRVGSVCRKLSACVRDRRPSRSAHRRRAIARGAGTEEVL